MINRPVKKATITLKKKDGLTIIREKREESLGQMNKIAFLNVKIDLGALSLISNIMNGVYFSNKNFILTLQI